MADFQERIYELADQGVEIVAGSADDEAGAAGTVEKLGLEFPVLHSLDAEQVSKQIGCYTGEHDGEPHVQPAAFILDSSGAVKLAMYSSDRVGRLRPEDVLAMVG